MILVKLFWVFARISLFAIGGGYSFLPLLERELVENYHWLDKEEFLDILGVVKIFPGAISVKYATYTGYKIAGLSGAIFANLGNIIGPSVLVVLFSVFYLRYKNQPVIKASFRMVQLAVFALMIALAFKTITPEELWKPLNMLVVLVSFLLFLHSRIHPAFIILLAALLGLFFKS